MLMRIMMLIIMNIDNSPYLTVIAFEMDTVHWTYRSTKCVRTFDAVGDTARESFRAKSVS